MTPEELATHVLDSVANGETVPGFEQVGDLLIRLSETTPVAPGVAVSSAGVAAATAASAPSGLVAVMATLTKPGSILLALAGAAVGGIAVVSLGSGQESPRLVDSPSDAVEAVVDEPAPVGAERVVPAGGDDPAVQELVQPLPEPTTGPTTSAPVTQSPTAPAETLPTSTMVGDVSPTTTAVPETSAPPPVDDGDQPGPPDKGNGKGNNGNGKGNGGPGGE